MSRVSSGHRRKGFTRRELLVGLVVLALLLAILIPAVQAMREAANRGNCQNHLRMLLLSFEGYEFIHGKYPAGRHGCDSIQDGPCQGESPRARNGASAFIEILPFLEADPLYKEFDPTDLPYNQEDTWPAKNKGIQSRPDWMVCPSDTARPFRPAHGMNIATGSYALVHGKLGPAQGISADLKLHNTGVFNYKIQYLKSDIRDGLGNTLLIGEVIDGHKDQSVNLWSQAVCLESSLRSTQNPPNTPPGTGITTAPKGIPLNAAFASRHKGGANFVFGDGQVRFLTNDISPDIYQALSTRAGGEEVKLP